MRFPYAVLSSVCALMLAIPLLAQSPNGVINGLVVDPSNKVIAGADILVVNDVTGVKYSSKTNDEGIYVLPNLQPGPYRIQVSRVGFKTLIKPDIVLNVQDALSINFTLAVGAAFETVTVEGGASMINTTDASVSTVIDHTYVENMPLNGRSFQDLILLTPGTVTNSPQSPSAVGQTGEFSVNGQRTESNYYTVDGVSANVGAAAGVFMTTGAGASGSVATSTALGTTQALVSVDDLQEFRVQSSTYSAEYGRNPGGQFAFETKSGTNQWHASAYDYLRNNSFDAPDWFTDYFHKAQPSTRQNDFGGTFGGPVEVPGTFHGKDKTFFFISYEGLRLRQPQAATASFVPDLCMRSIGVCPSGRSPAPSALQPVLKAFPLPSPNGLENAASGFGQFIGTWSNPSSIDSTSVRFDHTVNDKLRLFFRFSDTDSSAASRSATVATLNTISAYTMRTYTVGASSAFSSRLSNESRLNFSSNGTTSVILLDDFGGSTPVDLRQLIGVSNPAVQLVYSGYAIQLLQNLTSGAQRQWNLIDTVSRSVGRHQFKLGADYRRLAPFEALSSPSAQYNYLSEPSVEKNHASVTLTARAPGYPLYVNFSAFAQDEWRVARRLSLSLGLRWEVNPAPGATKGLTPYTLQGSSLNTLALAPQGTPLWQTSWYNFAPRLGVAYLLSNMPGWETVVRGGGGVFFDTGQQSGSLGFTGIGFSALESNLSGSFPLLPAVAPTIVNPPVAPYASDGDEWARHLQLPYTLQWNGSIEQALGNSQALSVSYVGSHAARLLERNLILTPSNPNLIAFFLLDSGLTSDYNSLQGQFQRRLNRALTALASYTWSHCIDYGSSNLSFSYQRGNCDFDVRHNLSAALSYNLPNSGTTDL